MAASLLWIYPVRLRYLLNYGPLSSLFEPMSILALAVVHNLTNKLLASSFCAFSQGHLPDWWEMYDASTGRAYYFNNSTQETVWVLPQDLNVIPVPLRCV